MRRRRQRTRTTRTSAEMNEPSAVAAPVLLLLCRRSSWRRCWMRLLLTPTSPVDGGGTAGPTVGELVLKGIATAMEAAMRQPPAEGLLLRRSL